MNLAPVHFLSHGTTMVLGERSNIADYWEKIGQEAVNHGVNGIIIMGAHWEAPGRKVQVAMNPNPRLQTLAYVKKSKYANYKPNTDLKTGERCIEMLQKAGFEAEAAPQFDWRIDTFPVIIKMFPNGCPPTVIISMNAYFDPYDHMRMGATLRPLRKGGFLLIGSGGGYTIKYRDTFAQLHPPDEKHLEFRQALEDVICRNGGSPGLRRGLIRLMKHPNFRDAHGTDDHYMPACFVAGAVGDEEDRGADSCLGAECWELLNQGETQFTIGSWPVAVYT
ncbi:hypothetical protein LCI18_010288 [Fusarium solani-melongenae]|uniref:Uncharacterized protein n=1 Tax=Fusarium solani subsp. cucurbitae TaxID=2747967 RepID=A0ACD3ZDI6_FUSSC|nr:hypothetical protein LCI18_010288 [Fusarium solani-melongenae]